MNSKKCCPMSFSRLTPELSARLAGSMHSVMTCDISSLTNGITFAEFALMVCMEIYAAENNGESVAVAEAALRLRVSVPAISRLIKNLQSRGLLERRTDEADRRVIRIELTQSGRELYETNKRVFTELFDSVFSRFSDDELMKYVELYCKFADTLTAEIDKASHIGD